MRLRDKIEFRGRAPAANFHVVFGGASDWNAFMRQIGDADEHLAKSRVIFLGGLLQLLNLLPKSLGLRYQLTGVLSVFL